MRICVEIDDELMKLAKEATGLKTKKAVVEAGLRLIIKYKQQVEAMEKLRGAADWQGDIRAMRGR